MINSVLIYKILHKTEFDLLLLTKLCQYDIIYTESLALQAFVLCALAILATALLDTIQ